MWREIEIFSLLRGERQEAKQMFAGVRVLLGIDQEDGAELPCLCFRVCGSIYDTQGFPDSLDGRPFSAQDGGGSSSGFLPLLAVMQDTDLPQRS